MKGAKDMANGAKKRDNRGRVLPVGITQRKDGRYQIRITKDGVAYVEYDRDLNEAKKKLDTLKGELVQGTITSIEHYSLDDWYMKWLETHMKGQLKIRTYNNYKGYYERHIKGTVLGKKAIKQIRQEDIIMCLNKLGDEKELAHRTLELIHTMLKGAFQQAYDNGYVARNPAHNVMKRVKGKETKERTNVEDRDKEIFMEYLSKEGIYHWYEPFFGVLFYTGMRTGEIRALTWKDIDFEREQIYVYKTLSYGKINGSKTKMFITSPKTKSSVRSVPMTPQVKQWLLEQKRNQVEMKRLYDKRYQADYCVPYYNDRNQYEFDYKDFVFTTTLNTIATNESYNRTIKYIVAECNNILAKKGELPMKSFTLHQTRHTFASECAGKGIDERILCEILGHSDPRVTKQFYIHESKEIIERKEDERKKALKLALEK